MNLSLGLWSWVYHKQKTAEGKPSPRIRRPHLDEEAAKVSKIGASVEKAKRYIADQIRAPAPDEFLTSALYSHLPHQQRACPYLRWVELGGDPPVFCRYVICMQCRFLLAITQCVGRQCQDTKFELEDEQPQVDIGTCQDAVL